MSTKLLSLCILGAAIVVSLGCSSNSGIVTGANALTAGSVPDLTYRSETGQVYRLDANRAPLAILAFPSTEACDCCKVDPRVSALAEKYRGDRLSVIQVLQPSSPCPAAQPCRNSDLMERLKMKSLCDAELVAGFAFHPRADEIVLIDENNRIQARATLADPGPVTAKAGEMLEQLNTEWEPSGD